jgi:hypothetical protein
MTVRVLTSRPNVTPVEAESGVIFGGGPPAGSTDEANLDVEMVYAMAPKATISVFQGTTGITDRMDAILHHMATFTPPQGHRGELQSLLRGKRQLAAGDRPDGSAGRVFLHGVRPELVRNRVEKDPPATAHSIRP